MELELAAALLDSPCERVGILIDDDIVTSLVDSTGRVNDCIEKEKQVEF
jgi:hypothetical protein